MTEETNTEVTFFELSREEEFDAETQSFLADGGDLNEPTPGCTRLHVAVREGYLHSVTSLLWAGADPNALSEDGNAPLHELALNPNRRGAWENSGSGTWRVRRTAAELLRAGADPLLRNAGGDMPLHCAVRQLAVAEEHAGVQRAVVRELLLAQTDPDAVAGDGATPLTLAAKSRFSKPLELLLRARADPNRADGDGWCALHHAAHFGAFDTVAKLLSYGADPNRATPVADEGRLPLHVILDRSGEVSGDMPGKKVDAFLKTVGVLAKYGSPFAEDACGRTPMDQAKTAPERVRTALVDMLEQAYALHDPKQKEAPAVPEMTP